MPREEVRTRTDVTGVYTEYFKKGKMVKHRWSRHRNDDAWLDSWHDSKSLMHTSDDSPAFTCTTREASTHIWFRHGQIYRKDGKPTKEVHKFGELGYHKKEYYYIAETQTWINSDQFKIMKLEATVTKLAADLSRPSLTMPVKDMISALMLATAACVFVMLLERLLFY